MNRLGTYLEKADSLARKVKGAMVYPITIMVVAIGVLLLLMIKVIPVFEQMFNDFGGTLPGPTQVVVNTSHWLQSNIGMLLEAAGMTRDDVAHLRIYLLDRDDIPALRQARTEFFGSDKVIPSTLVLVSGLVKPEWRVELEIVAAH